MDKLYKEMKEALRVFDLGFHEMDKVKMEIVNGEIIFKHANINVTINLDI